MSDSLLVTETNPDVFDPDEWPLPDHFSDAAVDAVHNVLSQRPDLAGGDVGALEQAGELITLADALGAVARLAGYIATGSTGQVVTHPAVTEARLARTAAAAILGRLTPASAAQVRRMSNLKQGKDDGKRGNRR